MGVRRHLAGITSWCRRAQLEELQQDPTDSSLWIAHTSSRTCSFIAQVASSGVLSARPILSPRGEINVPNLFGRLDGERVYELKIQVNNNKCKPLARQASGSRKFFSPARRIIARPEEGRRLDLTAVAAGGCRPRDTSGIVMVL